MLDSFDVEGNLDHIIEIIEQGATPVAPDDSLSYDAFVQFVGGERDLAYIEEASSATNPWPIHYAVEATRRKADRSVKYIAYHDGFAKYHSLPRRHSNGTMVMAHTTINLLSDHTYFSWVPSDERYQERIAYRRQDKWTPEPVNTNRSVDVRHFTVPELIVLNDLVASYCNSLEAPLRLEFGLRVTLDQFNEVLSSSVENRVFGRVFFEIKDFDVVGLTLADAYRKKGDPELVAQAGRVLAIFDQLGFKADRSSALIDKEIRDQYIADMAARGVHTGA